LPEYDPHGHRRARQANFSFAGEANCRRATHSKRASVAGGLQGTGIISIALFSGFSTFGVKAMLRLPLAIVTSPVSM
jgi:hypothetical protein